MVIQPQAIYRVSGNYLPLFIWLWYHRALTEPAEIQLDQASGYPQLSVGHMIHPGHMTLTPVKRQWFVFSRRHLHSLVMSAIARNSSIVRQRVTEL